MCAHITPNILKCDQNLAEPCKKICTVLPDLAESGCRNSSQKLPDLAARTDPRSAQFWQPEQASSGIQNRPVLGARTAAKAVVLARTVLSKMAAQFRQNQAVLAENPPSRTPVSAVHIYQPSPQRKFLAEQGSQ